MLLGILLGEWCCAVGGAGVCCYWVLSPRGCPIVSLGLGGGLQGAESRLFDRCFGGCHTHSTVGEPADWLSLWGRGWQNAACEAVLSGPRGP